MSSEYDREKRLAAEQSLAFIEEGMKVGLGTGSTAAYFIKLLGERVRAGLHVECIPTSKRSEEQARREGIPLTDFSVVERLDVTVDGADEVDPQLNLIKGGGGALLWEKIVSSASNEFIIVADSRKLVGKLGAFPLPVEVIPFGWEPAARGIRALGATVTRREGEGDSCFQTVEGNYILDCAFGQISDPESLAASLRSIPGVVEHGLFIGKATKVIIARGNAVEILKPPR